MKRTAAVSQGRLIKGIFPLVLSIIGFILIQAPIAFASGDLNGDDVVDAVFTQRGQYNQICYGNGLGGFPTCVDLTGIGHPATNELSEFALTNAVALGDWDDDQDLDIILAVDGGTNQLCVNNDGAFDLCVNMGAEDGDFSHDVALGDLNGDGMLDAVFANFGAGPNGTRNKVCVGAGNITAVCFEPSGFPESDYSTGVAIADIDNDSRMDIVFSNSGGSPTVTGATNTVCRNTGNLGNVSVSVIPAPQFDCFAISADADESNAVTFFDYGRVVSSVWNGTTYYDVNGTPDGLPDAIFANNGQNRICMGMLGNEFKCFNIGPASGNSHDVVANDWASPTLQDAYFVNTGGPNVLCLGFTCGSFVGPDAGDDSTGVALQDINLDGIKEIVIANWGTPSRYCRLGSTTCVDINNRVGPVTDVALSGGSSLPTADLDPPIVTVPGNITAEATSSSGAVVAFSVSAFDVFDNSAKSVSCDISSGSQFAIGSTLVTCTATDSANNEGENSFTVTVSDTTAPVLTLPANIEDDLALGASSKIISFTATATDIVDGNVAVNCSPASGSSFTVGVTTVNCSASDNALVPNTAQGTFTVTIRGIAQQVNALGEFVQALPAVDGNTKKMLANSTFNSLLGALEKGNTTAARNILHSFQQKVRALKNSGRISAGDEAELLHASSLLIASL